MTTKPPDFTDLNSLAIEACDMWQEHLSTLASDPAARADLTRFLEPQRRMFSDWASMMQQGGRPESHRAQPNAKPEPQAAPTPPPPAPPVGAAHGDDALRVAQLALRLAELERRVAQLESKSTRAAKTGAPRRTQRTAS